MHATVPKSTAETVRRCVGETGVIVAGVKTELVREVLRLSQRSDGGFYQRFQSERRTGRSDLDDKSDEANDERFSIVRGKSGQSLEKSWEKSDEVGNVRGATHASLSMFVANVDAEKKLAQLKIVNELFKIYFELNALHLCKNLINAVNLPTFLPFEESFPSSEKVTYHFYVGRLAVFDDDYEGASEHLKYAFERCPRGSSKNKTACLKYLVPVMLSLGFVPSKKLFVKYKDALKPYEEVCEAVKMGKLGVLEQALERRKARFVREGTYLMFEKLRLYCLRTLFKKTSEIQKEFEPEKANQVKLEMLSRACKIAAAMKNQHGHNNNNNNNNNNNTEYDLDEIECGVSELIHRKFVKGYVSHKNRVVVLSKTDAFPKISDVVK